MHGTCAYIFATDYCAVMCVRIHVDRGQAGGSRALEGLVSATDPSRSQLLKYTAAPGVTGVLERGDTWDSRSAEELWKESHRIVVHVAAR